MKTSAEIRQLMAVKAEELQSIYEKSKGDKIDENGQPIFEMDSSVYAEQRSRNDELNDLGRELEKADAQENYLKNQELVASLNQVDRKGARPASSPPSGGVLASSYQARNNAPEYKSLGELFTDSMQYKMRQGPRVLFTDENVELKTLLSTAAGFAPPRDRGPVLIPSAQRTPVVADLIPTDPTSSDVVKYMEETTFTNAAATVSQAAAKPESALQWTERSNFVEVIATWIPVTRQQIDDVPGMQGLINNRLTLMLLQTEETQLLTGNGTSPNLQGFLTKSGINTQARGSDSNQDAIYKAFTLIRTVGFTEPDSVVIHPTNWQAIRLERTTQGQYIFGDPSQPGVEMLFGKRVIPTTAITLNTALTGNFMMFSHLSRKQGITLDISDSHDVYFIANKLAIRIEERLSLEIYRAAAFATVTSLT